ncbi:hypothetical protein V5E97_27070 [Singulisphaera sp. Ch08]|uniref:Uncharacterized protein n=1 Tax=Singulisphaera sp. Ch08 TaxID=3120278 RepID=A0AAU7C9Y9_9BACT
MKIRVGTWTRIGLVLLGAVTVPSLAVWGQAFPGPFNNLTAGGLVPLPPPPPPGAWGEVIFANERWIVVQNSQGQQFPVAADSINQFLVRWPTTLRDLTAKSMVEATGDDLGSMSLSTSHIDIYEGNDQTLVDPTYKSLLPFGRVVTTIDPTYNRMMNGFDIASQNTLYGWAYPINPGENGIPGQFYAVGNLLGVNPVRIGVPGDNVVRILPDSAGNMSMSQVTRGTPTFAQSGDSVFLTSVDRNVKSLVLSQLVLYKKIPFREFSAPAP